MARSRFVRPHTTVLPLSDGDTITIKTRLSVGEQHDAYARMYLAGTDGKLHTNPLQSGRAMMVAYLVDWNLTDDGEPVPIKGLSADDLDGVLNTLDPESFGEIKAAIEAHERRVFEARELEKKTAATSGARGADPTSPSPSAADGVLSGSAP